MQRIISGFIYLSLIFNLSNASLRADPDQADSYFQAQQWEQAAPAYQQLVEQDSSNSQYWFRLGQSLYQLNQYQDAIPALQKALQHQDSNTPVANLLVLLARSQAGNDDNTAALDSIAAIEATGARPYLALRNSSEFAAMADSPEFVALLETLKPCNSDNHRAFDLWLGEWQVTSPSRPGWTAKSSITLANDGCSVHENYVSQGGYAGRSINFYDPQKQMWHQTWIDNQGAPIYLEGRFENGAMILSDETNRVTWSTQPDNSVRQHWETTNDGGSSWTTAFDGYYRKP